LLSKTYDELLRDTLLTDEERGHKLSRQEKRFLARQMDKVEARWECPFCHHVEHGGVVTREHVLVNEETGKEYIRRFPRQCPSCGSNMVKTKNLLRRKKDE